MLQIRSSTDLRSTIDTNAQHSNPVICTRFISVGSHTVNLSQSQIANDILAASIDLHPTRFGGWATVPVSNPTAAADEVGQFSATLLLPSFYSYPSIS